MADEKAILKAFRELGEKIFSVLRTPKEESTSFSQIYEQVWMATMKMEEWVWLIDVYTEDDGSLFAIMSKEGLLFRAPIVLEDSGVSIGELTQVKEVFEPVSNSKFLIKRQDDGTTRWFLVASSNVLNRNAAIDSAELFDNLIKRAQDSGNYPFLTFYHLDEAMKMGMTDWVARDGSLLLASGTFEKDNKKAECMIARAEEDPEYWGSSISFFPITAHMESIAEGVKVPVYTDGEFYEISTLAEKDACCLFTALKTSGKVNQMKDEIKDAIKKLAGDDTLAEQFISDVDQKNSLIKENSLITRQAEEKPEELEVEETPAVVETPVVEKPVVETPAVSEENIEIDEAMADEITEKLAKSPQVSKLSEDLKESALKLASDLATSRQEFADYRASTEARIKKFDERLEALEADEEEKAKNWKNDLPRASRKLVSYRARDVEVEGNEQETSEDIAQRTLANIKK